MQQELARLMKEGMRRLASGVAVISTQNEQGQRFAMTASSVTSVSDAPPSLLVCVHHTAGICSQLVPESVFAVNILGQHQIDVSVQCSVAAKGDERFELGAWRSEHGAPVLDGCEVVFINTVQAVYAYGTHNIVIGDIKAVQLGSAPTVDPLVYLDGAYRRIAQ